MALVETTQKIKALIVLFLTAGLAFASSQEARLLEPAWEKALGGNAACPPVAFKGRIYVLSVDRALTCIDEAGGFVWRKALKNRPAPRLTVSRSGLVCVFGRNGEMTAYSANGVLLWTYSGKKRALPVVAPHEGRDGRLFLLYEDEMICLASNGTQKWRVKLNGRGAQMIGEDGRGNALIVRSGGELTPVTPYGTVYSTIKTGLEIRRALPLVGNAAALLVSEGSGYKIVAIDFNLPQNSNSASADILWECGGLPQLAAAMRYRSSIFCAGTNGRLLVLNVTDGALLLQTDFFARGSVSGASLFYNRNGSDDRIILLAQEMCVAFSLDGEVLWQVAFSKPLVNPVFTENSYAVSAPQNSVITAYRAEVPLGNAPEQEARTPRTRSYGIFTRNSFDYIDPQEVTFHYFEELKKRINEGTFGVDEQDISQDLAGILNNGRQFDPVQRSLAAQLLGMMGSDEARGVLIDAARNEGNPTVIAGLLRGLAALGPENGRQTFDAVLRISSRHGRLDEISALACDALFAVAKSSYGEIAAEAVAAIYAYTGVQYSGATRKYALQMVEKLIE